MKTFAKLFSIVGLLWFPLGALSWAGGGVSAPVNMEGTCHGFECATALFADVLRSGGAAVMNLARRILCFSAWR